MELPCTMQSKVLGRQQYLVPNCIFNVPKSSIGILLLVRLSLQQTMLNYITNFLPGLHFALHCLYCMHTI